ncbi:hypothetical protein F0L74_21570 [Chitinophaga agrisoli]|uniref:Uncharacterized protein n=1 Tax=Chitinophaga agrisoli TaxID=2607653 RepID=A0A5B2VJT4_9BACT|nr:hypothetical protein [Chitinophaga agrisoli]KAA2238806.1 hypothetical protein F0L74_21570 [Chitinophaga agrisoli]
MTAKGGGRSNYQRDAEPYSQYTNPITRSASELNGNANGDDCDGLVLNTLIQNVKPGVRKVNVGDRLSVRLGLKNSISVYNLEDEICGDLILAESEEVVKCLKKGKVFIALVKNKRGNTCEVVVKPQK